MKAPLRLLAALIALATALTWIPSAGAATTERFGHAAGVPNGARALGALDSRQQLQVTVALQPRDPGALSDFATAVSTSGSGIYHQFLTVSQFAQRFGATRASQDAVLQSLREHGLDALQVNPNGLSITVTGSAATVEKAFSVNLTAYDVDGQHRYAADSAPALDSAITGEVQSVSGLDNLLTPQPHVTVPTTVATGGPTPSGSGCPNTASYNYPNQLATQYDLDGFYETGDLGAGQTIGLVEYESYDKSDIDAYVKCLNISDAAVTNVAFGPAGGTAPTGPGVGEAALDIEDVLGLAPAANVQVYVGNSYASSVDMYTQMTTHSPLPTVISSSWGFCEPGDEHYDGVYGTTQMASENTLFQEAAAQGQTVFSAAGDDGSSDCYRWKTSDGDPNVNQLAVDDPASQPFVTGVGGTAITNTGPGSTESVWQQSNGGTGGGYSNYWLEPNYQAGAASALGVPTSPSNCTHSWTTTNGAGASASGCREVPDVAADASPATGYEIYYDGAWVGFGGTSASAPLWGAFTALANDSSGCTGKLGFINPALYSLAGTQYARDFNDVTTGANGVHTSASTYSAKQGFDLTTGLGTPNGTLLAGALCNDPVALTKVADQATQASRTSGVTFSATPASGITFTADNLPGGMSISSAGAIIGTATTAGTYYPTVVASNGSGQSNAQTFTWTISSNPVSFSSPAQTAQAWVKTDAVAPLKVTVTDSNGGSPSYSVSGLPAGVALDATSHTITGTPTNVGSGVATITVTDGADTGQEQFAWTVANPAVSFTNGPVGAQSWVRTNAISALQVPATDSGNGTVSYSASGLPAGVSINTSSGAITGTPTATGSGTATITASSSNTSSTPSNEQFTWTVSPTTIVISGQSDQTWISGTAVSVQLSASDNGTGQTPTFTATGLPAGVSISSAGLISGVPTGTQSASPVQVTATDSTGSAGIAGFNATVNAAPASAAGTGSTGGTGSSSGGSTGGTGSSSGGSTGSTGSTGGGSSNSTSKPPVPSSSGSASGATTKHPKFVVTVKAASGSKLSTVVIHLPGGFSASRTAKKVKAGITLSVKGATVKVSGSTVTVTKLKGTSLTVTFSAPDLTVAKSLVTTIKKHKAKAESFTVTVNGHALKLSVTPR